MVRHRRLRDAQKLRERAYILSAPFLQMLNNPHTRGIRQYAETAGTCFFSILHSDVANLNGDASSPAWYTPPPKILVGEHIQNALIQKLQK